MSSSREIPIESSSVFVHAPGQVSSELDGETVMMSIENGKYYGMDRIGTRIWSLIENPNSIKEVCRVLRAEFNVSPEECEKDVTELLQRLLDQRLVTLVSAARA